MKGKVMVMLALGAFCAEACTGFISGRKASATGRTIVAHNEDNNGNIHVEHVFLEARRLTPGLQATFQEPERARLTPPESLPAIFWSELCAGGRNPPAGDLFLNEYGVIIFSNNGGFHSVWEGMKGELPDEGPASTLTDGGLGHDLRLAVAQRARSAREGVDIITNLVTRFGYARPSRIFSVADRDEAWVVEVIKGRRYVARRCPDDEVMAYPNALTIGRLRDGDIVSANLAKVDRSTFDFAARYQGPRTWHSPYNIRRMMGFYAKTAGLTVGEDGINGAYPFSLRPAHPITAEDIKAGLTTHFEGLPYESTLKHKDRYVTICRETTRESMICIFGRTPAETELLLATGSPCRTPYIRVRPFAGELPPGTVTGDAAYARIAAHCSPRRTDPKSNE